MITGPPVPRPAVRPPVARPVVLVLEHSPTAPLGALDAPLRQHADLVILGLHDGPRAAGEVAGWIVGGGYDGVVVLGGPMGVYDADTFPFLTDSLRVIRDALDRELPLLGICLGSQLLAEALGSRPFLGRQRGLPREVGFLPLHLTAAGAEDPLMSLFVGPEPVNLWHQDTNELPEGAVLLASTDLYPMAAFRWGRWAYGIQYHPETDLAILERRVSLFPEKVREVGMTPEALLSEAREREPTVQARAEALAALFAGWAAEVRERRGGRLPR